MNRTCRILIVLLLTTIPPLAAQNAWSVDIRPDAAFPTSDPGDVELSTGFGFDATVAYRFMPHLGGYAGWSWNHFAADQAIGGQDITFEETGYGLGLRFIHPIGTSGLSYLVEGGALIHHIEVENDDGDIVADSDHGLGWQVGAGLAVPLGERLRLMPGIRYRALSRDLDFGPGAESVDLNYLSVGLAVSWMF